jgi:hypothetical protein
MDQLLLLRDEIMGFRLEELALLGQEVEIVACADGRLTDPLDHMAKFMRETNGQKVTINRFLNCLMTEDVIEEMKTQGILANKKKSYLVLSHEGCAAAMKLTHAMKDGSLDSNEKFNVFVASLKEHHCENCADVEKQTPAIVAGMLQKSCADSGLGALQITTDCIETPKVAITPPERRVLVVTNPLTEPYAQLGLDPKDTSNYYLSTFLPVMMPYVKMACEELGIKSVRVISQSPSEDSEVTMFVARLRNELGLKNIGVKIADPELVGSRIGKLYMPATEQKPAPSPQPRATKTMF